MSEERERERARAEVDRLVLTGEFFEEGPKGREAIERLTAAEGAETSGLVISEADLKKLEGEWRGNNKKAAEE